MSIPLSEQYEHCYDELLQGVCTCVKAGDDVLTALWPMCGHRYDGRLMIVGRAPNGWEGGFTPSALGIQRERAKVLRFARDVAEKGVPEWRKPGRCPMLWVADQWNDPRGGGYTTNKSRLWLLVREMAGTLRLPASASEEWPSAVCWSDLYKVAPKENGNPREWLKRAQLASACRLLAREVQELNPRLVVVLAGREWYAPFVETLGLKLKGVAGPAVEAVALQGDRQWLLAKPPTYMAPGVTVEAYQSDVVSTALHLARGR